MQVGVDKSGVVWLAGDAVPTTWNAVTLQVYTLTDAQTAAWKALPSDRTGTTFDGQIFTAVFTSPVTVALPALPNFLTANDLAAYLRSKGLI